MDILRFTDTKTGNLVPILHPEKDHAFIPADLPSAWQFFDDKRLLELYAVANRQLGILDGVARNLKSAELFLKPLQRIESLTSSRLEGTVATAQELILFEMSNKENIVTDQQAAWQEVANYNDALTQGVSLLAELPICVRVIKDVHKTLMSGVRGGAKKPGEFRSHQVHIGSTRRYVPPPASEVERCIYSLENYLNRPPSDDCPALIKCFMAHYQLEAIHPFSDGNGRIGRVLLSLMIYKWCEMTMPCLYMSPFFERYKDEYIDKMFKISTHGAWSDWIEFCLRGVIEQAKKAANLCDDLRKLKDEMHGRVDHSRGGRIHPIIESLFVSPFVRVVDLAKKFGVRHATAKADVIYLASKGILMDLPDMSVTTYFSREIFRRCYMEDNEDTIPSPASEIGLPSALSLSDVLS